MMGALTQHVLSGFSVTGHDAFINILTESSVCV